MTWTRKHLLGLEGLAAEEITELLDAAERLHPDKGPLAERPLAGWTLVNLFFEPSTRTALSFEKAAKRLGMDVVSFSASSSSLKKGETLLDTAKNIEAMGADAFVIRHSAAGAPHLLARHTGCAVLNAGDGCHEHPTQGLLDIYTIRERKGRVEGLTVAIVGDIAHSRVARSDLWGLKALGAKVVLAGPPDLVPPEFAEFGAERRDSIDEALADCDVVNMLRIQRERLGRAHPPSPREYNDRWGLTAERLRRAGPELLVLHPGPMNRGVEIDSEVADGSQSAILRQVTNGVAVRTAALALLMAAHGKGAA